MHLHMHACLPVSNRERRHGAARFCSANDTCEVIRSCAAVGIVVVLMSCYPAPMMEMQSFR